MSELTSKEDVNEWWEDINKVVRKAGEELFGKTFWKDPQGKDT